MLLKQDKEKALNIRLFKSLEKSVTYVTVLLLISSSFAFSFKGNRFLVPPDKEIKAKVNFSDNPNQQDFFTSVESGQFINLGPYVLLEGVWSGSYELDPHSIFWINSSLDKLKIHNLINFGHYNIALRFNLQESKRLSSIEIVQEDVKYDPANVGFIKDSQINYWTKAKCKDWLEIIRGKIFRRNSNELLTVFQTTVYENKVPIYAFRGEALLKKSG